MNLLQALAPLNIVTNIFGLCPYINDLKNQKYVIHRLSMFYGVVTAGLILACEMTILQKDKWLQDIIRIDLGVYTSVLYIVLICLNVKRLINVMENMKLFEVSLNQLKSPISYQDAYYVTWIGIATTIVDRMGFILSNFFIEERKSPIILQILSIYEDLPILQFLIFMWIIRRNMDFLHSFFKCIYVDKELSSKTSSAIGKFLLINF